MNLSWDPYTSAGVGPHHAVRPAFGLLGQFAERFGRRRNWSHVGLADRRADPGAVFRRHAGGGRPGGAGLHPQSGQLIAAGNNNFQLSAADRQSVIGTPGTGGRGTIQGGSLEASNVDIATEFTNLIVYQRGYEANANVVTTADN